MEFHRKCPYHFRGDAFWKSRKNNFSLFIENHDFFDFQNASSRKWYRYFRWNSSDLNYTTILQIDVVSTCVLIPMPLCMASEHAEFFYICIMWFYVCLPCSVVMQSGIGMSTAAETTSICSNEVLDFSEVLPQISVSLWRRCNLKIEKNQRFAAFRYGIQQCQHFQNRA